MPDVRPWELLPEEIDARTLLDLAAQGKLITWDGGMREGRFECKLVKLKEGTMAITKVWAEGEIDAAELEAARCLVTAMAEARYADLCLAPAGKLQHMRNAALALNNAIHYQEKIVLHSEQERAAAWAKRGILIRGGAGFLGDQE